MTHIVIIGGGITGLAAAWTLQQYAGQQHGIDYTLLEASDRFGGKIRTEHVDGFLIESGADSFLTTKPAALQLCEEIGFTSQLIPTNPDQKAVYIYRDGALYPFPKGMRLIVPVDTEAFLDSATVLSEVGRRRMIAESNIPARVDSGDESLAAFVRRRFGGEALTVFGSSLLSGIHVGDPDELSIGATFPDYTRLEREYGSLIRGLQTEGSHATKVKVALFLNSAFVAPKDGMSALPAAIRARLTGELRLNAPASRVWPDRSVELVNGEIIHSDGVIITTPATAAGRMLGTTAPDLSADLSQAKANSSATVSLGYRAEDLERPMQGYGFVVPRGESVSMTACTWSSSKLAGRAPDGYHLLRVFIGGSGWRARDLQLDDPSLISLVRRELAEIMGIQADPVITRVHRWTQASPQYLVGHLDWINRLQTRIPSWLALTGCAYEGVGIPDCIRQGRTAALNVLKDQNTPVLMKEQAVL